MWLVEPETGAIRLYSSSRARVYIAKEAIADWALPGLELTPRPIFVEAELIDSAFLTLYWMLLPLQGAR